MSGNVVLSSLYEPCSVEIFFSKLRSAGLNYNLPSFFTESYCAGVSNKHCLLTFFILFENGKRKCSKFYNIYLRCLNI